MTAAAALQHYIRAHRTRFTCDGDLLRAVYWAELASSAGSERLANLLFDTIPTFYREPDRIVGRIRDGFFATAFKEALRKLPTATSFQESHFGEVTATLFAEAVLGLTPLYTKLSQLSTQNANGYKMDLLFCDFAKQPLEFVLGEVKASMKSPSTHSEPFHESSCFASIFTSLNGYTDEDQDFDLVAIEDNVNLPAHRREAVLAALLPNVPRRVRYAAFAVIDADTRRDGEMRVLATRRNDKTFEVDVVCVETLPQVVASTWQALDELRAHVSRIAPP